MPTMDKGMRNTLKILFRVVANVGLAVYMQRSLPEYFILTGGIKAAVAVGLVLAFVNAAIVPVLNILSLPVKLFAWMIGSILVNLVALWITVKFISLLALPNVLLTIGGGFVGWILLSVLLGFGNYLIKHIVGSSHS